MSGRPTSGAGPAARDEDDDALFLPSPVPSPCVNVCRMDPRSGLCEGCQRTLDEIAGWGGLDDEGKRAVWARIVRRRVAAKAD